EPGERLNALLAKLKTYVGYILSDEFAQDNPDIGPDDVSIGVVCANPPTAEMLQITHVKPRIQPPRSIPIQFLRFEDGEVTPYEAEFPEAEPARIMPRLVTAEFVARANADNDFPYRRLGNTGLFVAYVVDG